MKKKFKVSLFKIVTLLFLGSFLTSYSWQHQPKLKDYYMVVGTYTKTGSKGIYVYKFNPETGKEALINTSSTIKNPSYLAFHGANMYAVSETNGKEPGSVSAYHFDKKDGELHYLNNLPTGGDDPCYLQTDSSGKFLAVANYTGGSLSLFHLGDNGKILDNKQFIQHHGSGFYPERQGSPHVHETVFSPNQKYLITPDLGKDKVIVYRFEKDSSQPLSYYSEIACKPGSGPRHIVFNPKLNVAYLIHEINSVISVYHFNHGHFEKIQELNGWPSAFAGAKDGSEIIVSPDGKFLYTSHRAEQNEIGIFKINPTTGKLSNISYQSCGGKGPRFITIDPTGNWLFSANQASDNITVFKRDKKTGGLRESGFIKLPIPVCIQFTNIE